MLSKVVLPEPDGPVTATHSPSPIERLRSSRARSAPKRRLSPATLTRSVTTEHPRRVQPLDPPERQEEGGADHERGNRRRCRKTAPGAEGATPGITGAEKPVGQSAGGQISEDLPCHPGQHGRG